MWTEGSLRTAVSESHTFAEVFRKVGVAISGKTYRTIKQAISHFSMDTSHFRRPKSGKMAGIEELKIGSSLGQSSLKTLIRRLSLLKEVCKECGNPGFHNGRALRLQLDHENGVSNDNRLENLRWLCPNCHTQTPTYSRVKGRQSPDRKPRKKTAEVVDLVCSNGPCSKTFQRRASLVKYRSDTGAKKWFCSNTCKSHSWREEFGNRGKGGHGTLAGYFHCPKPRCGPCLKAMREYKAQRRKNKPGEPARDGTTFT